MWGNYGRILSEYPYISNFRRGDLDKYIKIENIEILEKIKKDHQLFLFQLTLVILS